MKAFSKTGVATGAAVLALFGGVQVANAGIGDVPNDPQGAVKDALPNPPEADPGAVVEQATEAVDEATGTVDAEAAAAAAKVAVDNVVADPEGPAETVVEQAKNTVENPTAAVKEIADKTPAGKALKDVTTAIDPVVASAGKAIDSPKGQAAFSGVSAPQFEAVRQAPNGSAPALSVRVPVSSLALPAAAPEATRMLGSPGSIGPSAIAPIVPNGASPALSGWTRPLEHSSASTKPAQVSSAAPAAPFAPPLGDSSATAASVAGAAGAALLAALFGALFFLAPRTGRLTPPGPNLVRAEPCLSLPERPG